MSPIARAIKLVGGASALAEKVGAKTPQVVSNWRRRGSVPPEYCLAIERATGGKVTRQQLRPELWGDIVLQPQQADESDVMIVSSAAERVA